MNYPPPKGSGFPLNDLLVYRVSCEFDLDKYAREYDLKEIEEPEEGKEM